MLTEAEVVRPSSSTTQAADTQVRQVGSASEAVADDDKALQVLENRLRDWMTRNSPAPSRDTWHKPFSANSAPPRITELRRVVTDVRNFLFLFFWFLTLNLFLR